MKRTMLAHYSLGTGDRFAHQAAAQLGAVTAAAEEGIQLDIVWNKSFREHSTIGSEPVQTRTAGDRAADDYRNSGSKAWKGSHHFDADHIRLETVDGFLPHCDFFTLDVADEIGKMAESSRLGVFLSRAKQYFDRELTLDGQKILLSRESAHRVGEHFLAAARKAGDIYRHIIETRNPEDIIIEVSMDETSQPQSPGEIFYILLALAMEEVPLQTFAPRFSGRFNKGVEYVGDAAAFAREFEQDALILRYAAGELGLPENLKLSLHSGSDKFAIYEPIKKILAQRGLGLHVKTAGTTWLEEVIGLCEAGGDALALVKTMYGECLAHREELCAPYAEVIDIDVSKLPTEAAVQAATGEQLAAMIRHDQSNALYNPSLRQLFHVGYKVAAKKGREYLEMLEAHEDIIARQVRENLLVRHIRRIFPGA